jgi:uracil phosphoribosyltransferase
MQGLAVCDHPLLRRCVTALRDRATPVPEFHAQMRLAGRLLAAEATRDLPTRPVRVRTPLAVAAGHRLAHDAVLVAVLRAGLGLLEGFRELLPDARVGFVGLKRCEETFAAVNYLESLPPSLAGREVFVLDPMLATGGSAVAALDLLAKRRPRRVQLVSLVAAPEGVRRVRAAHPRVRLLTAALDKGLDEHAYIVPGLGDAGDRLFGS